MKVKNSRLKFDPSNTSTWPPLLNVSQTSKILNLSVWTLRQWDNKGKLVAIRFGSRRDRRYKKEDILKVKEEGLK